MGKVYDGVLYLKFYGGMMKIFRKKLKLLEIVYEEIINYIMGIVRYVVEWFLLGEIWENWERISFGLFFIVKIFL